MKLIGKSAHVLYTLYALITFIILMLVVMLCTFIASMWGRIRGGNIIYKIVGIWADIWFFLVGVRQQNVYLSEMRRDKPVIFVINHISYMDIPMVVKSIRQPVRILGKMEMAKIPVFGYIYRKATVMVDRNNTVNRTKSVFTLKSYLKKGISIVIFPEGTFNETTNILNPFYNGAFRIAIETQTPIKPVIFPDTQERMHYSSIFTMTPGISRAVFMEEVPVDGLTIHDLGALKERVHKTMEAYLMKEKHGG